MRPSLAAALLSLAAVVGCDDPKKPEADAKATASATASAKAAEPAAKSAEPAPAPPPKKQVTCKPGPSVDFADKALETEIRRKLSKPQGPISPADLKTVRSVNISQGKVDELDPCVFPLLLGVKEVFLAPGDLYDLGPLSNLVTLESLRASVNKVSDLKPLSKLTKMDRLDLGRTGVRDLTPLSTLVNLTELQLDDTEVIDLSPLAKLDKLERLSIKRTQVKDLGPLAGLKKLKFLYIEGTSIDDLSPVGPLVGKGLKIVKN